MTGLLRSNQDVVYTEVEDEIVMMAPEDGSYHGLNTVGAEIWKLLVESPMNLNTIVMHLQQTYALNKNEAEKDARIFIDMMVAQNFVVEAKS